MHICSLREFCVCAEDSPAELQMQAAQPSAATETLVMRYLIYCIFSRAPFYLQLEESRHHLNRAHQLSRRRRA